MAEVVFVMRDGAVQVVIVVISCIQDPTVQFRYSLMSCKRYWSLTALPTIISERDVSEWLPMAPFLLGRHLETMI